MSSFFSCFTSFVAVGPSSFLPSVFSPSVDSAPSPSVLSPSTPSPSTPSPSSYGLVSSTSMVGATIVATTKSRSVIVS